MTINKTTTGTTLTLAITGEVNTGTAPELEKAVEAVTQEITKLVFDLEGVEYISSAGLRVLIKAQKRMNRQGSMTVKNAGSTVMTIFEETGFTDFLDFE